MNNYTVDWDKWSRMDIVNQMGNIESEVGRSISAKRQGDEGRAELAIIRVSDLFGATADGLAKQKSPRLREILRTRDQYLALFFDNKFVSDADGVERYFMQYTVVARNR